MRSTSKTARHNAGLYGVMYGTSRRHQRAAEDAEIMREWEAHERGYGVAPRTAQKGHNRFLEDE